MTTLQELYEHFDSKELVYLVVIGGADVTHLCDSVSWTFEISQVPVATIEIPANLLVPAVAEEAAVEIWVGFRLGMTVQMALVYGDGIVSSVSYNGPQAVIECVQDGPRRITVPYYRQIEYDFDNVTAQDSVVALLGLAGVSNYVVDLDPWDIGTAVPQKLQFSTYGEAINKVSEVDGSPWFAMPSGQIRVEKRDPLPYDDPARVYYGSSMLGIAESHPTLDDAALRPRLLEISKSFDREGVANFIEVDGAVLVTIGPNGEQNSEQIKEEVDGAPGNFTNGAPWIPTPPLFQMFTVQNELIDTNAKAFSTATRYYNLKNRLIQNTQISIPLDPLVFLAMTVKVIDPRTNTNNLYFLRGYRCSITSGQASTELTLLGGPFSGTQGHAAPFAEFIWKYRSQYQLLPGTNPPNSSQLDLGWQVDLGAKLAQDLPADTGHTSQGGDKPDGKSTVFITFDASPSMDFDGRIVQYDWSDDQGHTLTSILPRFTVIYDPDDAATVQMTLTVTDDTARTDTITKSVYVGATAPPGPAPDDPTLDDSKFGGGVVSGPVSEGGSPTNAVDGPGGRNGMALVFFVAAGCKMMATADNRTWNDIDKDDLGVGDFISVGMSSDYKNSLVYAVFGTDDGFLVLTRDGCQSADIEQEIPGNPAVNCILFDPKEVYRVWAGTSNGQIWTSMDSGVTWDKYFQLPDRNPINKLMVIGSSLVAFGGDTGDVNTLIRYQHNKSGEFVPLTLSNALIQAVGAAGPGFTVEVGTVNEQSLLIGFNGGVSPTVWTATDPIGNPETWIPSTGLTGAVRDASSGFDGKFIVSTDDGIFRTLNSEDFDLGDTDPVNALAWEGLDGVYLGLKDTSITKTPDDGVTQGDMRPNPDFTNTWPACATGHEIAVGSVPRDEDGGYWPAPGSSPFRASKWLFLGFSSSHPNRNGGMIFSLSTLGSVTDMVVTEMGSITVPNEPTDDLGTSTITIYTAYATGPSPSATGISGFQWFTADGPLDPLHLNFAFGAGQDNRIFPAPGVPGHLSTGAIGLPLPSNKFAGAGTQGSSFINTTNVDYGSWGVHGGIQLIPTIGPGSEAGISGECDFSAYGTFPPHLVGRIFVIAVTLEIT